MRTREKPPSPVGPTGNGRFTFLSFVPGPIPLGLPFALAADPVFAIVIEIVEVRNVDHLCVQKLSGEAKPRRCRSSFFNLPDPIALVWSY